MIIKLYFYENKFVIEKKVSLFLEELRNLFEYHTDVTDDIQLITTKHFLHHKEGNFLQVSLNKMLHIPHVNAGYRLMFTQKCPVA